MCFVCVCGGGGSVECYCGFKAANGVMVGEISVGRAKHFLVETHCGVCTHVPDFDRCMSIVFSWFTYLVVV